MHESSAVDGTKVLQKASKVLSPKRVSLTRPGVHSRGDRNAQRVDNERQGRQALVNRECNTV